MDATEWLGLQPTHNPHRWYLPVIEGISTTGRFLFGGCGLAAGVAALEHVAERPLVWATAQYLSFAMVDEVLDLDVTIAQAGHVTTQARVVAKVGEREVLTVNGALGAKQHPVSGQWVHMPAVSAPDGGPLRAPRSGDDRSIMDRLEIRLALGTPWEDLEGHPRTDGHCALWVRLPGHDDSAMEISASALAILGDYVPFGISQSQGTWWPSNSLDNTLRVVRLVPTEWVLVDVRVEGVFDGFGHGTVFLWAQDGTLLATASQSALLRSRR